MAASAKAAAQGAHAIAPVCVRKSENDANRQIMEMGCAQARVAAMGMNQNPMTQNAVA